MREKLQMKVRVQRCILTLVATIILLSSFSLRKPKKFIPPGTVQITENFFADEVEITNFSWREYENWTKIKYGKFSPEHLATLPDTNVWRNKISYNEPYASYYYQHPAYKNYPVVGISYEQAVAYCKWRTEKVKEFYRFRYKKEIDIEYRLPSKQEWEIICCSYPIYMNNNGKNEKGFHTFNFADTSYSYGKNGQIPKEYPDVTAPVTSYARNMFGIYNTYGNVAEMLSEKGICKGGSWKHNFEECRAGKDIPYEKPTAWLGLRCVCVKGS
jgi:formylglycine-generating enzyme required for sulfatase activity